MPAKRIISDARKSKLTGRKVHKGKTVATMNDADKDDLLQKLAEEAGLL